MKLHHHTFNQKELKIHLTIPNGTLLADLGLIYFIPNKVAPNEFKLDCHKNCNCLIYLNIILKQFLNENEPLGIKVFLKRHFIECH